MYSIGDEDAEELLERCWEREGWRDFSERLVDFGGMSAGIWGMAKRAEEVVLLMRVVDLSLV